MLSVWAEVGATGAKFNSFRLAVQFGGARLLTSRLRRTLRQDRLLAPPKTEIVPPPLFGWRCRRGCRPAALLPDKIRFHHFDARLPGWHRHPAFGGAACPP